MKPNIKASDLNGKHCQIWTNSKQKEAQEFQEFLTLKKMAKEEMKKEVLEILENHINFLQDKYGDIMDTKLLRENVVDKIKEL